MLLNYSKWLSRKYINISQENKISWKTYINYVYLHFMLMLGIKKYYSTLILNNLFL